TGEIVTRARREHESARAALLELDGHLRSEAAKLERAIRDGVTPPETLTNGQDRNYVVTRESMTEQALTKFQTEHQEAQSRLGDAAAAVRHAAIQLMGVMLDQQVEKLRNLENFALQVRADLLKVTQYWPSTSGAIPLSESGAVYLGQMPD